MEKASNNGATILIAEDEPDLRYLLQNLLHSAGYQLLIAPDGKKALEIAEQQHGENRFIAFRCSHAGDVRCGSCQGAQNETA